MPIHRIDDTLVQLVCPIPFFEGTVNIYLLLGEPLTLIDAPTNIPTSVEGFEANLAELGLQTSDIERILCTHAHTDHMGMAHYIQERSGCEFWVHEDDADTCRRFPEPMFERHQYSERQLYEWDIPDEILQQMIGRDWDPDGIAEPVEVTGTFLGGETVQWGEEGMLEVHHVPGHCRGHVVYYDPHYRRLFSGDHVLPSIVPFADIMYLNPEGTERFPGLNHFLASLHHVKRLDLSYIYPSHGEIITTPDDAIDNLLVFHEKRIKQVERAMRKGGDTVYTIAERVYKNFGTRNLRHRLMLIMGCLDVLEERGRVTSERPSKQTWRFAFHGKD